MGTRETQYARLIELGVCDVKPMNVYGYFFVSILRAILKGGGVEHSFRELLYTIKSGRSVVGYYEHEL